MLAGGHTTRGDITAVLGDATGRKASVNGGVVLPVHEKLLSKAHDALTKALEEDLHIAIGMDGKLSSWGSRVEGGWDGE
eukprot:Skav210076  [mRNA]  locus=scaffold7699:46858:47579:+ [translate_table: standard]